jgi:spermidine synthase
LAGSLVIIGMIGMVSQAAYLREILAIFQGGELIIGMALLFWLLLTAAGSAAAGWCSPGIHSIETWFHRVLPWYGLAGYIGVAVIHHLSLIAGLTPGEQISFDLQFVAVIIVMAPCNLLGGWLFAVGAKMYLSNDGSGVGRAYLWEALGAAVAGIAISFGAYGYVSNGVISFLPAVLGIIGKTIWLVRKRTTLVLTALPLVMGLAAFTISYYLTTLSNRGEHLIEERDTRYDRLRVTIIGEQTTFFANSSVLFSIPTPEKSEYSAHIPLLLTPSPSKVLILGGGPGGAIEEALCHTSVIRVVCVELDPALFDLASKYANGPWLTDQRVVLMAADGRSYLRGTRELFDTIIMELPPPLSGIANRYYTKEFFQDVARHLSPNGIFSFSLEGSENYLTDSLSLFLASIRETLRASFPAVTVLPGNDCRFLAGVQPGMFDRLDWEYFEHERVGRNLDLAYVRDYYLKFVFAPERIRSLSVALDSVPEPMVNTDTRPSAFISKTVLQGELDESWVIRSIGPHFNRRTVGFLMMFLFMASVAGMFFPGRGALMRTVEITVVSVGMTEISLEMLAILAYQSVFGLLYARIALLTGAYMAGLAIGSALGVSMVSSGKSTYLQLGIIQAGIALVTLCWIALLFRIEQINSGMNVESLFFLLTAAAGILGGGQFPLADHLIRQIRQPERTGAGFVYALDLAGSSIGALATGSLLIPVAGMIPTLAFFSLINVLITLPLLLRHS